MNDILVVDDSPVARLKIQEYLEHSEYQLSMAVDGEDAWNKLLLEPDKFGTILLDRTMPKMGGMELLRLIKEHKQLESIPVIMQTANDKREEIEEGLQAGAYYYLTKPYNQHTLTTIVKTAVNDFSRYCSLVKKTDVKMTTFNLKNGRYTFRTLKEAESLSALMSLICPTPQKIVLGLSELLTNSIEHGNLGISYEEKSRLNEEEQWNAEVERRLKMPEYASKAGTIDFERNSKEIRFLIQDEGKGFDWSSYLEFSPERAFDTHGRGIAISNGSFNHLEYRGNGNQVLAVVYCS